MQDIKEDQRAGEEFDLKRLQGYNGLPPDSKAKVSQAFQLMKGKFFGPGLDDHVVVDPTDIPKSARPPTVPATMPAAQPAQLANRNNAADQQHPATEDVDDEEAERLARKERQAARRAAERAKLDKAKASWKACKATLLETRKDLELERQDHQSTVED